MGVGEIKRVKRVNATLASDPWCINSVDCSVVQAVGVSTKQRGNLAS